jgi:FkbH-like protein
MEDFLIITGEGRPKSASLASIASELAIAHSAILMIDDNPAQCHEISTGLPDVMTLLFEGHAPLKLDHIWRLDQVGWTREDEQRQQFYAEQLERSSHIDRFARRSDFFSSIDQQVVVRVASEADLPRVEQLSRRCNQFHSDGRRWSLTSIERHLARGGHCLVAKVSDRFGDLGVVAAIIFSVQAHRLDVDLLVISCRALDRDVEACLLGHLFASYGSISLNLNGRNSGRNDAFLRFAASIAKVVVTPCVPSLDEIANDLLPTTYGWTRGTKENDVAASTVTGLTSCRPELGHAARIFAIETLAQYHSASLILSAMGPLAGGGINNSAELSNIIRDAMSTALGGYSLELNDNFFDAGGDSLMAVEVLTELELILDIVIPLTILFDTAFTPSDIAAQIQRLATEMPPAGTRAN